jgi:hypothetical protein
MSAIRREGSTVRFGPILVDPSDVESSVGRLTEALNHQDVKVLIIDGLDAEAPSAHDRMRLVRWATEEAQRAGVRVEYRL